MCDALISDRGNDGDVGCAAAQCLCALRWHGERKLVLAVERAIRKAPHQRRGVQILHDRYAEFGQSVRPKPKSPLPKAGATGACGSRGQYSRRDFALRKRAFDVNLSAALQPLISEASKMLKRSRSLSLVSLGLFL